MRQRAAQKEVLEELRTNPFGGYGLYHLMNDAGLLSKSAKGKLAPLIENIEHRLNLKEEDLAVQLPLEFDPITDVEFDTLTYVIAESIREFIKDLPHISERLQLAELMGLNDTLERHLGQTSSLKREITLEQIVGGVLKHCGKEVPRYKGNRIVDVQEGDYMHIRNLARSRKWLPKHYVAERDLKRGEIVRVETVIRGGYMQVRRLNHKSRYKRRWSFFRIRYTLPKDNTKAVVYQEEGQFYRIVYPFREHLGRLVELYNKHSVDHSYDPERYQPRVTR